MAEELLLTDDGLSKIFNVSRSTIRTWKMNGQIPEEIIFKLPGTVKGTTRYIKSKVVDWINGRLQA